MKKIKFIALALIAFVFIATSCSKEQSVNPSATGKWVDSIEKRGPGYGIAFKDERKLQVWEGEGENCEGQKCWACDGNPGKCKKPKGNAPLPSLDALLDLQVAIDEGRQQGFFANIKFHKVLKGVPANGIIQRDLERGEVRFVKAANGKMFILLQEEDAAEFENGNPNVALTESIFEYDATDIM